MLNAAIGDGERGIFDMTRRVQPLKLSSPTLPAFLAHCPLFHAVGQDQLAALLRSASIQRVRKGNILFRQGERPTRVYLLLDGAGTLVRTAPKGHRVVLAFLRPGDVFGLIDLYGRGDQTYTAQMAQDSQVLSWSRESMQRIVDQHPVVVANALRWMARRVQSYWMRVEDLATEPVEQRVARTLLRLTRGTSRPLLLLHRDLAEFVGTTPPTLSRVLRGWRRQGIVSASRASVQLRAPDKVRAIADDP